MEEDRQEQLKVIFYINFNVLLISLHIIMQNLMNI